MKHILILHRTEYYYHVPVSRGTHRVEVRVPAIEPQADVRWLRGIFGNSAPLGSTNYAKTVG